MRCSPRDAGRAMLAALPTARAADRATLAALPTAHC
jgi:hypothetical protein